MLENFLLQAQPPQSEVAFNYILTLIPQLITIVAAIATGFKLLQSHNDNKIKETKNDILKSISLERQSIEKDMKGISGGITNLDSQYKIIIDYIKQELERHDHMLDRLDQKNVTRYGGPRDIEGR